MGNEKRVLTFLVAGLLLLLGVLFNPFSISYYLSPENAEKLNGLAWSWTVFAVVLAGILIRSKAGLKASLKSSVGVNVCLLLGGLLILLCLNRLYAMQFRGGRLIAYLILLLQLLRTFHLVVIKNRKGKLRERLLTVLFGLSLIFIVLEVAFMFVLSSHGSYPDSYANIGWHRKYWGELNSEGFREREFQVEPGKKVVLVTGDSFTAGSGTKDRKDRFSGQMQEQLGKEYSVFNLGMPGAGPAKELARLQAFPAKPDEIVLAYVLNDILEVARAHGREFNWVVPASRYPAPLRPLLHYSHFFNYLFAHFGYHQGQADFIEFLNQCFADPKISVAHREEMQAFANFASEKGARLTVVVFPLMQDLERSKAFTKIVSNWFSEMSVVAVDLGKALEGMKPEDLGVSAMDPHPGVEVHRIVGDTMAKLLLRD